MYSSSVRMILKYFIVCLYIPYYRIRTLFESHENYQNYYGFYRLILELIFELCDLPKLTKKFALIHIEKEKS